MTISCKSAPLPENERHGRRKNYLKSAEVSGGIDGKSGDFKGSSESNPPESINPPPYRESNGGMIKPPLLPPSLHPLHHSAGLDGGLRRNGGLEESEPQTIGVESFDSGGDFENAKIDARVEEWHRLRYSDGFEPSWLGSWLCNN